MHYGTRHKSCERYLLTSENEICDDLTVTSFNQNSLCFDERRISYNKLITILINNQHLKDITTSHFTKLDYDTFLDKKCSSLNGSDDSGEKPVQPVVIASTDEHELLGHQWKRWTQL